jgi:predicted dehydrogenase
MKTVRVGVAGLGYWGPNIARNLAAIAGVELAWCCDESAGVREKLAPAFPGTRFTGDLEDLLADDDLDAIALATPVPTHAALAERVLAAGKHCFVEKPLAQSVADAERVVAASARAGRVLMVGHLLQYHPGIAKLKEVAESGELGDIYYIYSNRLNLGKLRADENALWSLGAHDVSVMLHLADEEPIEVEARGESYMRPASRTSCSASCASRRARRPPAPLLARPAQGAALHRGRLAPDGHLRRHGARRQGHRVRQGLRRGSGLVRRVHHPLG